MSGRRRKGDDSTLGLRGAIFFLFFLNLTFSHSVFTCPSDNCLHSLSCSIHWSISFVNAFSSISVCFGGSPQFICRRVSWFRLGDDSPRCSRLFRSFTKRTQKVPIALLRKACNHLWPPSRYGLAELETSVGYPPQKFVCVELSAIKYRSSGYDLLNKSLKQMLKFINWCGQLGKHLVAQPWTFTVVYLSVFFRFFFPDYHVFILFDFASRLNQCQEVKLRTWKYLITYTYTFLC